MDTSDASPGIMLFFRGPDWDHGLSPQEIERTMDAVMTWFEGLQTQGVVRAGQPLAREGRRIDAAGGGRIADGPYAESKEGIGGYLILQNVDLDQAAALAKGYPALHLGISIEIRPMLHDCPISQRLRRRMELSVA